LSNSTSPLRDPCPPNRSVNCLPLSVMISSGTPNRTSASASARHTSVSPLSPGWLHSGLVRLSRLQWETTLPKCH